MKVRELIEALRKCPQDLPVLIAYDSFVCTSELTCEQIAVTDENIADEDWSAGVRLCAPTANMNWAAEPGDFRPPARKIA